MAVGDGDDEAVEQLINTAFVLGSSTVDLSKKRIRQMPTGLLNLRHLEFLYLEGNFISSIPEELFDCLPSLRWLDLRNNRVSEVPPVIGKHRNLRNLLLEGNSITSLPLELGLVKSLSGLNLSGNPLVFPPAHVVERGTQEILKFLREQYLLHLQSTGSEIVDDQPESSSSEEILHGPPTCDPELTHKGNSTTARRKSKIDNQSLLGPVNTPVTFHPPLLRTDLVRWEYDKQRLELQSRGGLSASDVRSKNLAGHNRPHLKKKPSSKTESVSAGSSRFQYDATATPRFPDYEARLAEQQQLAVVAAINEKEAATLQRRKNKQALDDWREHAKQIRQQKQRLAAISGPSTVEVKAPYGTEKSAKEEEKSPHGYAKRLKEILDEKEGKGVARRELEDRELETRIKRHIEKLQQHRSTTYGTIQEELESARKNLELAHQFRREVKDRKELEYRLRAFTGDDVMSSHWGSKAKTKNPPR